MSDIIIPVMENNPLSGLSYMAVGKGKKFHLSLRNDDTLCPASRRSTAVRYVSVDEGASGELCTSCYRTAEKRYEENQRTAYAAARDFELDALSHGVDAETAAQARKTTQEELMSSASETVFVEMGPEDTNYKGDYWFRQYKTRGNVLFEEMRIPCREVVKGDLIAGEIEYDGWGHVAQVFTTSRRVRNFSAGLSNDPSDYRDETRISFGGQSWTQRPADDLITVRRAVSVAPRCCVCDEGSDAENYVCNACVAAQHGRVMVRGTQDVPATLTTLDGPVAEHDRRTQEYRNDPTVARMIADYDAHVASVEKAEIAAEIAAHSCDEKDCIYCEVNAQEKADSTGSAYERGLTLAEAMVEIGAVFHEGAPKTLDLDNDADAGFEEVMVTRECELSVTVDESTGATVSLGWVALTLNAAQWDDDVAIAREYGRVHGTGKPRGGWEAIITVHDVADM